MDDRVNPIEPATPSDIERWDIEADVVVVGLGAAGAAATVAAADAGAEVVALERAGAGGGTSAMSGGLIYLGGGTPIQQACGFEDDPANMEAFLLQACGPDADDEKVHAYCEHSVAHFHWLVDHGVPFKAEFHPEPNREPVTDAGLIYCGGEDSWPATEVARPVPRGHHPEFPDTAGGFLMECLLGAVGRTAARVETDVRVDRLIVDTSGSTVCGVTAMRDGAPLAVRAHRGVVLAGGGFVFNDDLLSEHCPVLLGDVSGWRLGTPADDGRVIRMGQGAGGAVERMDAVECAMPVTLPHRLARGILVNRHGRRYVNEDSYIGRLGHESLLEQGGEVYLVLDEAIFEEGLIGMRLAWAAESVAELESDMEMPEGSLQETVSRYNADAGAGEDTLWHKDRRYLQPLGPPFGAVDVRAGSGMVYATFTLGGLRTDAEARVLDRDGGVVPGLFAAGRCTAGIAAGGYVSGISLGDGTFFGRRAGEGAAARSGE